MLGVTCVKSEVRWSWTTAATVWSNAAKSRVLNAIRWASWFMPGCNEWIFLMGWAQHGGLAGFQTYVFSSMPQNSRKWSAFPNTKAVGANQHAARVLILAAMKHMSLSQSWGRIIKSNIFSDWGPSSWDVLACKELSRLHRTASAFARRRLGVVAAWLWGRMSFPCQKSFLLHETEHGQSYTRHENLVLGQFVRQQFHNLWDS